MAKVVVVGRTVVDVEVVVVVVDDVVVDDDVVVAGRSVVVVDDVVVVRNVVVVVRNVVVVVLEVVDVVVVVDVVDVVVGGTVVVVVVVVVVVGGSVVVVDVVAGGTVVVVVVVASTVHCAYNVKFAVLPCAHGKLIAAPPLDDSNQPAKVCPARVGVPGEVRVAPVCVVTSETVDPPCSSMVTFKVFADQVAVSVTFPDTVPLDGYVAPAA